MTNKEILFQFLQTKGLNCQQEYPFWIWCSDDKNVVTYLHNSGGKWKANIRFTFLEQHLHFPKERGEKISIFLTLKVDNREHVVFTGYINTVEDLEKTLYLLGIEIEN